MRNITAKSGIILLPVALISVVLVWAALRQVFFPTIPTPDFHDQEQLIFAHRGGRSLGPENTIHTFQKALRLGAQVLEFDVRLTRDGHLVVFHDATVDRTTDGTSTSTISSLSVAQIAELDAAFYYSTDGGQNFPLRHAGIRVPTLTEVFRKFPKTPKNIEIKDDSTAAAGVLCRSVSQFDRNRHVIVASFHKMAMRHFRQICPDTPTAATGSEVFLFVLLSRLHLEFLYRPKAAALQIPLTANGSRIVSDRLIEAAHGLGLKVHVWTINHPLQKQTLFGMGVDGIMTDFLSNETASDRSDFIAP